MKLKLKGSSFYTTEEIQAESQRVLDRNHSKHGVEGGTGVYMREETISRVMAADRPCGEFYDFYSISLEYFGYHHALKQFHFIIELGLGMFP
jgi:hypothetical protein